MNGHCGGKVAQSAVADCPLQKTGRGALMLSVIDKRLTAVPTILAEPY